MAQPARASDAPTDALIRAEMDGLRLRAHGFAAPFAPLAGLFLAALLVWATGDWIPRPALLAWLVLLIGVASVRGGLALGHRRSSRPPAQPAGPRVAWQTRWLWRYRWAIAAHGVVWGGVAWLPATLDSPQLQAALVFVLAGLAIGAMMLTLYDLVSALLFALPVVGSLAVRLAWAAQPLPVVTVVAGTVALLLMTMLSAAGLRYEQDRRRLAASRLAERRNAEGASEAQNLLQTVFEHAGQGISVFDADLRLRAWNAQMLALTGLPSHLAQVGTPLRECLLGLARQGEFGSVDPDPVAETERRLVTLQQARRGVTRETRPDGRRVETRFNPLPGGGFVMFHVDITEREATRAAAARQQRMLSLVLERTEQGFWYIDNALRTTDANPAMCRMLGLDHDQMIGRSIYDFVDDENRAIFEQHVRLRAAGQADGYEIALRRSDGALVHCFNNATPVFDDWGTKTGALGLFSDISAQKRAEQQVRQASELLAQKSRVLEMTLDSLAQGVLNVDASGQCIAWNQRFLELLELPAELMATRPRIEALLAYQLAHNAFGPALERLDEGGRNSLIRAREGTPDAVGHRYRRTRADGTVIDVASHFAADGSLVRTFTDVTASVATTAALIGARDEAEAANRAKSDFLSRMSHELRTPLNAILGFGQLLQADADDPLSAGQRRHLDELLRGARHLLALINDVLDVARIEAGNLQLTLAPVDLPALVQDCLSLVQPMARERGVVLSQDVEGPAASCAVTADVTRLRQVVLNLLSNAIKFNREAGTVRVAVRADAGGVLVEVADQGPGIAPEQVPRLFRAFERLDMEGAVEGTGIGLALSRSLMALMHGEIGVRSTLGQGSVFWLRLPGASGDAAAAEPPAVAGPAAGGERRHDVLYIEDNEVNQLLMQGMLSFRPAIDLRLAALPEQGLAMAAAQPPDLVLLDIQLPGMDGFEVLERLRALPALRNTPVIAVSANAMPDDLADARRAGFADYLTKPVDLPSLLALVDRALH